MCKAARSRCLSDRDDTASVLCATTHPLSFVFPFSSPFLLSDHKKVLYDISCFPLRVETISRKKAKAELEAKLEEIEKALQLFSRKRVLIQP